MPAIKCQLSKWQLSVTLVPEADCSEASGCESAAVQQETAAASSQPQRCRCADAGKTGGRRRCVDGQMESWRGLKKVEEGAYFCCPEYHPVDAAG